MNNRMLRKVVPILQFVLLAGCAAPVTPKGTVSSDIATALTELKTIRWASPPRVLANKEDLEREMLGKGEVLSQPVVRIEDLSVEPNCLAAGSDFVVKCRFAAYGPVVDQVVPTGKLRLLRNGILLVEVPLGKGIAGRSEITKELQFPKRLGSGECQVEIGISYGAASDIRLCALQVVAAINPGAT